MKRLQVTNDTTVSQVIKAFSKEWLGSMIVKDGFIFGTNIKVIAQGNGIEDLASKIEYNAKGLAHEVTFKTYGTHLVHKNGVYLLVEKD